MEDVTVFTTADARDGFRLAGVAQLVVDPPELEQAVRAHTGSRGKGLLIVDERLLVVLDRRRLAELTRAWRGVVLTLPAPREIPSVEDEFQILVRRALGYHIRLQP